MKLDRWECGSSRMKHNESAERDFYCIVNLSHIKRLKGYTIYLDNGEELLLTQKRVSDFKEKMNRYFHER